MKVYIEAGANDGIFQSRTLKYKDNDEWLGILVEPDPRCYKDLVNNRLNARTTIWTYALVGKDYMDDKVTLNQHYHSAMNSVDTSNARDEQFASTVEVDAIKLGDILVSLHINVIDELYLDVEGLESIVMSGIYSDQKIRWAEIELHRHDKSDHMQERECVVSEACRLGLQLSHIITDQGHPKMIFIEQS